jgi:hypothetical protein
MAMGQAGAFKSGHKGPFEYRGTLLGPQEISHIQQLLDGQVEGGVQGGVPCAVEI